MRELHPRLRPPRVHHGAGAEQGARETGRCGRDLLRARSLGAEAEQVGGGESGREHGRPFAGELLQRRGVRQAVAEGRRARAVVDTAGQTPEVTTVREAGERLGHGRGEGQVVEVVAQNGMLAISMKALALENGTTGEQIRLRNLESRREINGEVINENKVHIRF